MAKKKNRTKRKRKTKADGWGLSLQPLEVARDHPKLIRGMAIIAIVGVLVYGVSLGLDRLEAFVHAQARYDRSLALEWENLPDWLQLRENQHILKTLTRRLNLRESDRQLDVHLASRLGTALSNPEIGWVRSVERILVRPDGVVSVRCQFRRPTAWVLQEDYCYLVDSDGIRLPGRYEPEMCERSPLLTIDGVASPPPGIGQLWPGADLASGLKLAALIVDQPFRRQVNQIVVSNHDGRIDRNRAHLEIATDRPGSRIWWGRPPNEEYGTEVPAARKIALLETLYQQWGRIDLNRAYVDVRTHPDSVSLPAVMQPVTHQ